MNISPIFSVEKPEIPMASEKLVSDLLVDYLEQLSVKYVFGVPGGAIEGFYNAMGRSQRRGGLRPILARHETGAAFMADGYYRKSGILGVCCSTTGPGTTNLITGVASAYENQIPMLVITAQTALSRFGKNAWQESSCTGINTVGMFEFCTRYNTLVSHTEQFEHKLASALFAAFRSPMGPVHLSIPRDILNDISPVSKPRYDLSRLLRPSCLIDEALIDSLLLELKKAKKAVFMIGSGCFGAIEVIVRVAELIGATMVTEPQAKGLINAYHPLYRGVIGFAGHDSAIQALIDPEIDIVLVIGSNLGELSSNAWDEVALLHDRLIHIDLNEENLGHSPMAKQHVHGNIYKIFEYLHQKLNNDSIQFKLDEGSAKLPIKLGDEGAYWSNAIPIKPQSLMRELADLFPEDAFFLSDTGNSTAWATHYLHPRSKSAKSRFLSCLDFAAMGWAIGAAVGIGMANPHAPVVCILGDGSFLMNGQEIGVALQENLSIIFVVLNDAALGMVMHGQRLARAEQICYKLPEVDYAAMAEAMGIEGHVIRSVQELRALDIKRLCNQNKPCLLDVRIDAEQIPPISLRMQTDSI